MLKYIWDKFLREKFNQQSLLFESPKKKRKHRGKAVNVSPFPPAEEPITVNYVHFLQREWHQGLRVHIKCTHGHNADTQFY